ncbi:unnamed protein product [Thelazia callipaeda]|uniref:EGF-like domain-containing protein n=1 Tax=Thelazia callipaeda TaxID=103827 RepID=A0A0N5CXX4_THECL|nr:unnamed protein product [Thelazia callipaeda]
MQLFDPFIEITTYPQRSKEVHKTLKNVEKIAAFLPDPLARFIGDSNLVKIDEDTICEDDLCNNRGTCIGTKDSNFCICKLGYTGLRCENTPCDSSRDCNGKGLCIGTSRAHSCVCQLGFTGEHCENSNTE